MSTMQNIGCLRFVFHKVDGVSGAGIAGAVFLLTGGATPRTATSDAQGKVEFAPLCPGYYVLVEQTPPPGYAPNPAQYRVLLDVLGCVWVNGQMQRDFTIANAPAAALTSVTGRKIWEDTDNAYGTRPPLATIALYRNGELYRTTAIDAFGAGNFIFEGLPLADASGQPYVYTVGEEEAPAGYAVSVAGTNIANQLVNVVLTGEWTSYANFVALINDSRFFGDFGSPVVEAGVLYAYNDPTLTDPMASVVAPESPFYAFLTDLANGPWYYAAYVRTQDGYIHRGEIKAALYP